MNNENVRELGFTFSGFVPRLTVAVILIGAASMLRAEGPGQVTDVADFANEGEAGRWQANNVGPKTSTEVVPGPEGKTAFQVRCVYEPQLSPQAHSPAPYMTFRRLIDGAALARLGCTRLYFWHQGDRVQVVFNEKDKGDAYYAIVPASETWHRATVPLADLAFGWSYGANGKGAFDLTRMESFHLAISPPPGESREFRVAAFTLERNLDDLDPREFRGDTTPARMELYPRDRRLPVNRSQPLLAIVGNADRSGLPDVDVEFSLTGPGRLCGHADREGRSSASTLRVKTGDMGKAQARYIPPEMPGRNAVVEVRIVGNEVVPPARVRFETTTAFRKVRLGPKGMFIEPDGSPLVPLGSLFMPWWAKIEDGVPQTMSRSSVIVADETDQRAWFHYLHTNGVNYVRGYWGWGNPLPLGHDGAIVPHCFCLDGAVNEPIVAALERTLAIGGKAGIGFSLTIANSARPFIKPTRSYPGTKGKNKRKILFETLDGLRSLTERLMFNPNVWAYELTNEQSSSAVEWSDLFVKTIKEIDEVTAVMISHGGGALRTADPLLWMERTGIDLYQPHCYPDVSTFPDRDDIDAGLLQDVHYNAMPGPKPWFLGEAGGFGTHPPLGPAPDAETQRYLARDCIWFALLNRSIGASIWGIKHHATTEFKVAAEIAPLVDWSALAAAKAPLGVALPRDIAKARYFNGDEGKKALDVLANYAKWALERGIPTDVVFDNADYAVRRSAHEPFAPPELPSCFIIGDGYQLKARMSRTGDLVVGYLRNVSEVTLYRAEPPPGSKRKVTGAYIRRRAAAPARLDWQFTSESVPARLTVWDLDTGEKTEADGQKRAGTWQHPATDHDFLLLWRVSTNPGRTGK